mmetsp:Transcript_29705/g.64176  ORF Transcript_29705/g.64176 Transcript_29705/m.64176 type:complete len:102 (-) Transcript_29705:761-1066(-)
MCFEIVWVFQTFVSLACLLVAYILACRGYSALCLKKLGDLGSVRQAQSAEGVISELQGLCESGKRVSTAWNGFVAPLCLESSVLFVFFVIFLFAQRGAIQL